MTKCDRCGKKGDVFSFYAPAPDDEISFNLCKKCMGWLMDGMPKWSHKLAITYLREVCEDE